MREEGCELLAVGLSLEEVLDFTLRREECVRDKVHKIAFNKLQAKYPTIDYINDFKVTVHSIAADCGELEVIFNIQET